MLSARRRRIDPYVRVTCFAKWGLTDRGSREKRWAIEDSNVSPPLRLKAWV